MSTRKFKHLLLKESCKGCLLCVYFCSTKGPGILKASEERTSMGGVHPTKEGECIGCRWCERICPDFAISVIEVKPC